MNAANQVRPPAIVLGGDANALSIARSLGRRKIPVFALNDPSAPICYSRYARHIDLGAGSNREQSWLDFLLSERADGLRGAVLLAASDSALELFISHRDELAGHYLLDDFEPAAQRAMLDKLATYEHAVAAGVDTPRFWKVATRDEVISLEHELPFPLMIKPLVSHVFWRQFGCKYLLAHSFDEVCLAIEQVQAAGIDVMLVEMIPGADDQLCSYYTYIDESGEPLFHFTKRIIRRYPASMGLACYHITDLVPEIREPSLRLLREVGLRGLANLEFKLDPRDGRMKLIECNARFTASNCLVARAGYDLAAFVYDRLTGNARPLPSTYRLGLRLWDPLEDFKAFIELRRRDGFGLGRWLSSVAYRQTFPFFTSSDPRPAVMRYWRRVQKAGARLRKSPAHVAHRASEPPADEGIPERSCAGAAPLS